MKWLQKNHKRNAVILESALVILVLYFRVFCKVKPDTIMVMLSFGVLTANVLVYWLWGLPSAAMTMTYTLLFTVSVAAGVVLALYVPLPDFLSEGIWIAPIIGVDCFFIAGINLPQIVKTSMEAKLEIIKEDSVYDMEEGEKNEIEEKTTYNVYIQLRDIENIRRNPGKSYSLGNVSKPNFWFRIIVGGIVFIFSLFSFLIGSNGEDQALTIWNSWVFWTFVGGLSGMIIATAILLAGFLRALITAAVCVICLGVGIGFYYILSYIHTVSILLFSILLVCIILLIITVYVEILKRLSQKRPSGMEYYKANVEKKFIFLFPPFQKLIEN